MARMVLGLQAVREAIRAHRGEVERVVVASDGGPKVEALARFARDQGISVVSAGRGELDSVTRNARHQGVLAYAPDLALLPLARILEASPSLVAVLDNVMDPQNFGAVLRSAVALGAEAVVWPESGSAPLSPATFRASAGAVEYARLCRVPALPTALQAFSEAGLTVVGLDAEGSVELSSLDLTGPTAIVVGAEDKGLHRAVRRACSHVARLPMRGTIASLNASVAAGIALYEVARQRALTGRNSPLPEAP